MSAILKSIKFAKFLNGRLSYSLMKPYFINGRYITGSHRGTRQTQAYATAAYKIEPHEDFSVKNENVETSNAVSTDITSIDGILMKIDSLIRRTGRTQMKNVYQAFSLVTSKEVTSSTHGLYLIRSCKYSLDEHPSKRIDLVNQIWNRYQELGIEFDVQHYNSLLNVHISNGFDFNPAEFLASMEEVNIQPNKDTYLLIMKKYCQDGNIDGASEILQHMKKEGLSANEKVFNYLIEGHIKNNDFPGAKEMVEVMRSSSLQPNDGTYIAFACGYASIGEKDEMLSCLKKCSDMSDIQKYLKVIDALATSSHHEHIDEVLSMIQHKRTFREEFINFFVEMIHKDQIDIAYKLSLAAWSPENNESTNIFIKQLIRGRKPTEKILHYCQRILDEGLNKNIYLVAAGIATENGLIDCTTSLFKKRTELGYYLRASNFWPLISSVKQQESHKDAWLILKKMFEFGIFADFTTYLDVLYPALGVPNPKDVILNVKKSGQTLEIAADSLFAYYCNLGEIDYAAELIDIYPVCVGSRFDTKAFLNKGISDKYLKVLRYILTEINTRRALWVQGNLLAELVIRKVNVLEALLKKYEDLSFSPRILNMCEQEVIQRNPARQAFVKKLRNISVQRGNMSVKENISVEEENECIDNLQAQNIPCGPFLAKRVLYHIKQRNAARVSELMALFEKLDLTYSPLIFANLMTMHCMAGDIEKAIEAANKLKSEFPSFKLDILKLLEYVINLTKYEKFEETIDALEYFLKEPYSYTDKDKVLRSVRQLIGFLGHAKEIEFVKKVQNLLFPLAEEIGSRELLLEAPVRYYLQRNDLAPAFDEFKNVVNKDHIPAGLNSLLRKSIKLDDKDILQKVIDLATSCSRKAIVLLELAVACIESHHTQRAMRIIENLGSEIRHRDFEEICMKLCEQHKLEELEQLLHITRTLHHVDTEELYMVAIRTFAKNYPGKAKKLFAILKEEIPDLKPETINYAENVLKISNQPNHGELVSNHEALVPDVSSENIPEALEATKTFIEHLEAGNAEPALIELSSLKKGYIRTLPLKAVTDLIDLCLQQNCMNDLSTNVHAMSYIIDNVKVVLQPILEKYSAEGDVEKFSAISVSIPEFSLMAIGFNTYFCKAYINSGQHEDLLSQLEKRIDKKNKLFSQFAFDELLKFPEYEERIFNLAVNYFNLNYHNPMGVLWAHYFSKENFEKADEIFKKYSLQLDKLEVIMKHIRRDRNVNVALKYVEFVTPLTVRLRMKQRAYGTALELLVANAMHDEAAALVVESERLNLDLHKYYMTPLITLKNTLEKENKPVPFSIPLDAASDSSSVPK